MSEQDNQEPVNQTEPEDTSSSLTAEAIANMSEEDFEKIDPTTLTVVEDVHNSEQEQPQQSTVENTEAQTGNDTNQPEEANQQQPLGELTDAQFREILTRPFRARKQEIQITDPNEAIKLMQQGVDYYHKMQMMKPHQKVIRTLESKGLLDANKINFMVDLMEGNPEAVAQFLKEKEIDTYNLPDVEEQPHKANNYIPSEKAVVFEEKVTEIAERPEGSALLETIKSWGNEAVAEIYEHPRLLDAFMSHIDTGLYQDTMSILERERVLGNIDGSNQSMMGLYDQIATMLLGQNPTKYQPKSLNNPVVVGTNYQQPQQQIQQNSAKQQAQIPTGSQTRQSPVITPEMIANMSDEDFAKLGDFDSLMAKVKIQR